MQSLYFLSEKLQEERYKNIDAEQYEILRKKLLSEAEKRDFLPKISDRVSADLAKMLLFDAGAFRCTTIKLYENTKNRDHAADDWRRVISGTEKEVVARKSEEGKILFEKNLPENLYIVYPPELTYRILDGEGRVGANLIEISYKRNKILLECGTELEATEYGRQMREAVFRNRYDSGILIITTKSK